MIVEILMGDDGEITAVVRKAEGIDFEMAKARMKRLEQVIGVAVAVRFEEAEQHLHTHETAVLEVTHQRVQR